MESIPGRAPVSKPEAGFRTGKASRMKSAIGNKEVAARNLTEDAKFLTIRK
jgi:hypothetical protein